MPQKTSKVAKTERRKRWNDRRKVPDRRNPARLHHMNEDCRSNIPRRESDISGTEVDGELWWSGDRRFV